MGSLPDPSVPDGLRPKRETPKVQKHHIREGSRRTPQTQPEWGQALDPWAEAQDLLHRKGIRTAESFDLKT
jgi:hypothetical protein